MRYRRIPFDWVIMTKALRKQTEHLRPNLIPVLQYPDGAFRGETTMLAYDLEARHSERSVGLERLEIKVWDLPYALAPFKYQVKCLQQLRSKFAALEARDRAALQPILVRTGCWEPIAAA